MIKILSYAIIASSIVLLSTPFLPSSLLIQLKDIEIEGSKAELRRTVTVPTDAYMTYEIGNGVAYPQCNRDGGIIHYESRGEEPVVFDLICDPPEGELVMRYCVQVVGPFGIRMRTSCIEEDFYSGPRPEERLQKQLDDLKRRADERDSLGATRNFQFCSCEREDE